MRIILRYSLICMALLAGLYLYFMYRSQDTVVNIILEKLGARDNFALMDIWNAHYSIPQWCMYSLPEGLWVFAATLLSLRLVINIKQYQIKLKFLPFALTLLIELLQSLRITNGQFDWIDVAVSLVFTAIALAIPSKEKYKNAWGSKEFWLLMAVYCMVYLSDVWAW